MQECRLNLLVGTYTVCVTSEDSHKLTQATMALLQMVFSSSCTVYGNPSKVPIDETHPLSAVSPYGRSKLIIEDMFRDLAASPEGKEWRIILLRYFNPVGAHPSGMNCNQ